MTDHPNAIRPPIAVNPDRLGGRRAAKLSEPERELYRAILRRFASGEVVRRADLETAARDAPVDASHGAPGGPRSRHAGRQYR